MSIKNIRAFLVLIVFTGNLFAWSVGELTVTVANAPMNIKVSVTATNKTLIEIISIGFGTVIYDKITAVKPTTYGPNNVPALQIVLASHTSLFITEGTGGLHFTSINPAVPSVWLKLKDQGEHFYGILQHNTYNLDLRGQSNVNDRVATYLRDDEDAETYSGFFYTTLGYAGFFDSFATGVYNFGVSGATIMVYNAPAINWYLFYGPKLSKIQKSYFQVIGKPRAAPMWACGPLVWHDNYTGSEMILNHAKMFTEIKIPYSTIWIDRPYNNGARGWSNMNFEGNFANAAEWVGTLATEYYVKMVTWIMPGVFEGAGPPNYFKNSLYGYLDLTDPAQITWYKNKILEGQYKLGTPAIRGNQGVMGHKLDRVDNGWFPPGDLPPFKDGTPHEQRHKKFVLLNCKIADEMIRELAKLGTNSFIFPRCAVAGCQQYITAIWNGDSFAEWPGLKTSLGNAIRAGFLGFPMWGSDIGGYVKGGMPTIENYCRWLSFGVYSGFMELMLDQKEPWKLSVEHQALVRDLFNQRFHLLPYIYSIINNSAELGVTMMPLQGEYPDDANIYALWDQYLFGPAMLVAPLYTPAPTRQVYLPAGKWINMHNYADEQTGPKAITSPVMPLTQIPVYIKSNSIYPTGKIFGGLAKKWDSTYDQTRHIVINAFPGAPGQSASFTYIDSLDGNKRKQISVSVKANGFVSVVSQPLTVPCTVSVRQTTPPTLVYSGATQIPAPQYNATKKTLSVPVAANQPISISVGGLVGVQRPEPIKMDGRITAKSLGNGKTRVTIPRMSGLNGNNSVFLTFYGISGKPEYKSKIALNPYAPTYLSVKLRKGAYIAKITVDGNTAGSTKVILL